MNIEKFLNNSSANKHNNNKNNNDDDNNRMQMHLGQIHSFSSS